jgi:predicted secreted protein
MFAEREHSRGQIGGLIYSLGLLIIFSLSFAQTQLSEAAALSPDIAVNLNISDNGGSVTINKRETIGIVLQSNIAAGCQWVLDTSALNSDVVGEVGVTDVADEDVSIIVGNYVEPDGEYVRWIFLARESGFSNIRLNYKNVTDNEIAATFEVAVTVLSDPNESPCPFSLVVLPDRNYEAIPGQKCVFLVKVIDEGSGYGKGTVVNI